MIRGFSIREFLRGISLERFLGKVIFRNLQSMDGLCVSNHERPRVIGLDGVLIMLKTTWLLWPLNATSIGFDSWVTLPDNKGRPSITSTWIGLAFRTKGIFWRLANSSSKKQADAPESNSAKVSSFRGPKDKGIVKQLAGWAERVEPDFCCGIELSSRTVPYYGWASSFSWTNAPLVLTVRRFCFLGQLPTLWPSSPQYKHRPSSIRRFLSSGVRVFTRTASICMSFGSEHEFRLLAAIVGTWRTVFCLERWSWRR